ncbi:SDR family NAD(P)-dependent oxidoreductase [Paraburkholderia sp. GAS42]|uniref:SDR family NAD(P)-dependent oxidoreductase n=1 Tax=Paraburkholderia sp. GAS42 TaxID=3035135 RepID=UPI003D1DDF6C
MNFTLPDLVVVTGTANGLGRALAAKLVKSSVSVIGVDLADAATDMSDLSGYTHVSGGVDATQTWDAVSKIIASKKPKLIGLAHCAAMLVQGTVEEVSSESWRRILDVNVVGAAKAMSALAPLMTECGKGSIVLVGSVTGFLGEEAMFAYGATKGAVLQMVRGGALDFGRRQIRVNAVSPGPMATEMFYAHMKAAPDPAAWLKRREDRQPSGSVLEPEQVANAIIYFLSAESEGITGVNLPVDGGLTAGFEFRNINMRGANKHHGG